jgi:hypothetical protein
MMKLRWRRVAMLLAVCTSSPALAAGFDCTKASIPIEKAICKHPDLSLADFVLNERYQFLIARCAAKAAEQKEWVTYVRRSFAGFDQVEEAVEDLKLRYQQRNEELLQALDACSLRQPPAPLHVTRVSHDRSSIKLPWVDAASPEASRRVNDAVFNRMFGSPAPARLSDAIAALPEKDEPGASISDVMFSIRRNDGRLLVMEFKGQGCSAYCESFTEQMLFDSRTGKTLANKELFTAAGRKALLLHYSSARAMRGRGVIAKAGRDGISEPAELAHYQHCLKDWTSGHWTSEVDVLPAVNLDAKGQWYLPGGTCGSHGTRNWNLLDGLDVPLSRSQLAAHASPYGKTILLGEEGP